MTLIAWINDHDCGVTPTGVKNDDGSITVRVECWNPTTKESTVEETIVRTYAEARDALGY